jgi:hypothetical protein
MSSIFYTLLFFISISNIYSLALHSKIFKIREWWEGYRKVTNKLPEKKDYRKQEDFILINFWSVITILNYFFCVIGILTENWIIFLILLITKLILNKLSTKLKDYNIVRKNLEFLLSFIISFGFLFISLNHFHFNIEITKSILGFFTHID